MLYPFKQKTNLSAVIKRGPFRAMGKDPSERLQAIMDGHSSAASWLL
jgi:hypothetical protein